ncbi:MAG: hypothetical protein CR972_01935 [Candidatus Moraniibacteriota bacterium]|nr:MAG: hypothetical protein CR972_01935 [Candidatus Moranbacteria bacterium]
MIAHLRSIIFSLLFFFGIEGIISFALLGEKIGIAIIVALLVVSVFSGYNVGKKIIYTFLPLAISASSLSLLYFIDDLGERQIFGGFVSILFYMVLLGIKRICKNSFDMTARSFFSATLIATVFLFYAAIYGFYINFDISLWIFILVHFIFVTMVTFVSLRAYSSDTQRVLLYSVIIGFAMIQLVWMANFWPFGYLTMATISLMFYYVLWDLVQMVFLDTLSKKRIIITIIYCVVLSLTVLLTTQWLLVG